MSIDINNANFKIFTDFAATAKQSARPPRARRTTTQPPNHPTTEPK